MLYQFDGTKNGFLTAFVKAFQDEDALLSSKTVQPLIGQGQVCVETDLKVAEKAQNRLLSFDRDCMNDLDILLRSGMDNHEQIAFRYFRLLAKIKLPVGKRLADLDVFRAVECMKKVRFEIHRFHGFIRFMETASGALYAPFSPDNDICDLLAPYFKGRFPHFPFVLHDVKRQKAAIYDGNTIFTAPLSEAQILLSANELEWQALWKNYYAAVNIPSRERIQQMKGFMPTRYWKFLPEKQL
ncbi:MAG: TIGR03915 family putative DNA repair protein [Clostridia bacterium]|nr:TIGR03915 family putative DNA repair protein [Clostridia bacterium]